MTFDRRIQSYSFATDKANTRLFYLYRDAHNLRDIESYVFRGRLSLAQAHAIIDHLDGGSDFVPSAVGLEDLQDRTAKQWNKNIDHPYHQIECLELTDLAASGKMSAADFLQRMLAADWAAAAASVLEIRRINEEVQRYLALLKRVTLRITKAKAKADAERDRA